jgi:hypothetical protein
MSCTTLPCNEEYHGFPFSTFHFSRYVSVKVAQLCGAVKNIMHSFWFCTTKSCSTLPCNE